MRQKLLLLAAVFFGVLAFMFTYQQINLEKKRIQGEATEVAVLQATKDMPDGEKLTEECLRPIKVKRFSATLGSSREVPAEMRNMILDRQLQFPITAGQIIQWSDLKSAVSSGRGGLTSLIQTGYRAISIPVDSTASVTGLVQPNNYVDLVGTFKFPDMKGDSAYDTITLTILQRVRIIATGTDMGIQTHAGQRQGGSKSFNSVTLELSPKEVEMIVFASQKGRIQLSLRNYEESQIEKNLQSVNWKFLQSNIGKYMEDREKDIKTRPATRIR